MRILVLGESSHLAWILSSVELNYQRDHQRICNTVGQMVECSQLMCHRVAYAQECVRKCHTCHTGCVCHLLACLNIVWLIVSDRQVVKYVLHCL